MTANREVALDRVAQLVGDRWSIVILDALADGGRRYGELASLIPRISSNLLAQRLRALTAAGLLVAEPYSSRRDRLRYELSAEGRSLADALAPLVAWGARDDEDLAPRHDLCGGPLRIRWYCPTCDIEVPHDASVGQTFVV
jgi:DNA-binding HxlR family transcriptional regulator